MKVTTTTAPYMHSIGAFSNISMMQASLYFTMFLMLTYLIVYGIYRLELILVNQYDKSVSVLHEEQPLYNAIAAIAIFILIICIVLFFVMK